MPDAIGDEIPTVEPEEVEPVAEPELVSGAPEEFPVLTPIEEPAEIPADAIIAEEAVPLMEPEVVQELQPEPIEEPVEITEEAIIREEAVQIAEPEAVAEPAPEPEVIDELAPEPEPVMEATPEPEPAVPAQEEAVVQPDEPAAPPPEETPADKPLPEEGGQYIPVTEDETAAVGATADVSGVLELTDEEFTNVVRALTANFAPPWEQQFQRDKINQAVEISEEEFNFIRDTAQFS